jgi:hypothetical protein
MLQFAKTVTLIGMVVLVFAWVTAGFIPNQARSDFDRLVNASGGAMTHTPTFPDTYIQLCAQRRMLQNLYFAAAGVVCMGIGLAAWKTCVERSDRPYSNAETAAADAPPYAKPH